MNVTDNALILDLIGSLLKDRDDKCEMKECYLQALCLIDKLAMNSVAGLIVSDDKLTDFKSDLPDAFINTYLYIKALERCIDICYSINEPFDAELLSERIFLSKRAVVDIYSNKINRSICGDKSFLSEFCVN